MHENELLPRAVSHNATSLVVCAKGIDSSIKGKATTVIRSGFCLVMVPLLARQRLSPYMYHVIGHVTTRRVRRFSVRIIS